MERMTRTLLALALLVVGSRAVADPCAPLGGDTSLVRCSTLDAVQELAATLAQTPRVAPRGPSPLHLYEATVLTMGVRVPVTPLFFLGRPLDTAAETASFERGSTRAAIRARLWSNPQRMAHAWRVVERRMEARGDTVEELRSYVLRGGYAYTEDPWVAERWAATLSLGDVWSEPAIVLQRGDVIIRLERSGAGYVRAGDGGGEELRLLDRVAASAMDLDPPVALDLDRLRVAHGLARIAVSDVAGGWARVHAVTARGDIVPGAVLHDGERTRLLVSHPDRVALERLLAESRSLAGLWRASRGTPLGFEEVHGGGALRGPAWGRVEAPSSAHVPYSAGARFHRSLDAVPDRFHEGDVLVLDVDGSPRAWVVWQVDPVEGRPLMLLDGATPRPLAQVLAPFPSAVVRARLRRVTAAP